MRKWGGVMTCHQAMRMHSPVIFRSQCRKNAILKSFEFDDFNEICRNRCLFLLTRGRKVRFFPVFSMKSLELAFWTTLLGPRPDDTVNDLTAISPRGVNTLSIAVKTTSFTRFCTLIIAKSTTFLSSIFIFCD